MPHRVSVSVHLPPTPAETLTLDDEDQAEADHLLHDVIELAARPLVLPDEADS